MLDALVDGVRLAASFNPLASYVTSAVAAALFSREDSPVRYALGAGVVAAGWAIADGTRVVAWTQRQLMGGPLGLEWVTVALWAVLGSAAGYAAPTWAGAYVGRRVTFGTGWASAAVVAVTVSWMMQTIAASIG